MMVDIIIPAYNPGTYLSEAIESCLNQTYRDITINVIDDCSTQDLTYFKKKYPKVNFFRTPTNLGPAGARNYGVKQVKGELISFLDADDIADQNKIFYSVEEFKKVPSLGMVCGNYKIFLNRTKMLPTFYKKSPTINWNTLIQKNWVASGSVTLKRSVFEEVGGFDERFWIGEDYNLWLKISENYRIKYIPKVLYYYSVIPKGNSLTQRADIQKKHLDNLKIIQSESMARIKNLGKKPPV